MIAAHKEYDFLKKYSETYKSIVDEIDSKFGGMNSIYDAIRLAKVKEEAVAGLLTKLEAVLVSNAFKRFRHLLRVI